MLLCCVLFYLCFFLLIFCIIQSCVCTTVTSFQFVPSFIFPPTLVFYKRQRIPKGQSIMDNSDQMTTQATQKQTKQKQYVLNTTLCKQTQITMLALENTLQNIKYVLTINLSCTCKYILLIGIKSLSLKSSGCNYGKVCGF